MSPHGQVRACLDREYFFLGGNFRSKTAVSFRETQSPLLASRRALDRESLHATPAKYQFESWYLRGGTFLSFNGCQITRGCTRRVNPEITVFSSKNRFWNSKIDCRRSRVDRRHRPKKPRRAKCRSTIAPEIYIRGENVRAPSRLVYPLERKAMNKRRRRHISVRSDGRRWTATGRHYQGVLSTAGQVVFCIRHFEFPLTKLLSINISR